MLPSVAQDKITKKDGSIVTGQIVSVSDGMVMVGITASNGSVNKIPTYLTDIKSVDMATPKVVTQAQNASPAVAVSALEPVVRQYAGLPAAWVIGAMSQLAEAYSAMDQGDKALAVYTQIDTLYPGSKYHAAAVAGRAEMSLKAGKIDEALSDVQPLIDQADQDLSPSPEDGAIYAKAYIVKGQALEAKKDPQHALEAYLTVTTMFYQNAALAGQADALAKSLRDNNPGVGVE